jgi:hypothetical protein
MALDAGGQDPPQSGESKAKGSITMKRNKPNQQSFYWNTRTHIDTWMVKSLDVFWRKCLCVSSIKINSSFVDLVCFFSVMDRPLPLFSSLASARGMSVLHGTPYTFL